MENMEEQSSSAAAKVTSEDAQPQNVAPPSPSLPSINDVQVVGDTKTIHRGSPKKRERDKDPSSDGTGNDDNGTNDNPTTAEIDTSNAINNEPPIEIAAATKNDDCVDTTNGSASAAEKDTKPEDNDNHHNNSNNYNNPNEPNTNKNYNLIKNFKSGKTLGTSTGEGDEDREDEEEEDAVVEPIIANGMVEFPLSNIHKYLICGLCSGYYRDPYTITECLHTFCKSCLFYSIACGCHECPDCKVFLGNDPVKVAVLDHALQELVDRIVFPEITKEEDEQEQVFYAKQGIQLKPEHAHKEQNNIHHNNNTSNNNNNNNNNNTHASASASNNENGNNHSSNKKRSSYPSTSGNGFGGGGNSSHVQKKHKDEAHVQPIQVGTIFLWFKLLVVGQRVNGTIVFRPASPFPKDSTTGTHNSSLSGRVVFVSVTFFSYTMLVFWFLFCSHSHTIQGGDELEFTLIPEVVSGGNGLPPLDRPCLRISGKFRMNQLKKYLLQKLSIPSVSHATVSFKKTGETRATIHSLILNCMHCFQLLMSHFPCIGTL
jgi:hypothetical protein